MLIASVYNTFS
jgi:hypothetical protein